MFDDKKLKDEKNFLGYEFLTWAFHFLDRGHREDDFQSLVRSLKFTSKVSMVLGNKVVTCLLNHKEQKTSINCPILEESHEVFASLKNGHVIEALSLSLLIGEQTVSFTVHAQDFAFTNVKIKNNFESAEGDGEEHDDEEAARREEMFLRMALVDDAERIMDAFYMDFLRHRRQTSSFADELKSMRTQVIDRLDSYLEHKQSISNTSPRPQHP